jgi:DNA-directed RNA polymerase subunit RPC12/RpoP
MVQTALEAECKNCNNKFWYNGEKDYPETIECPECGSEVKIPEEG